MSELEHFSSIVTNLGSWEYRTCRLFHLRMLFCIVLEKYLIQVGQFWSYLPEFFFQAAVRESPHSFFKQLFPSSILMPSIRILVYSTLLYSTLLYSTLLYSTLLYSILLYSTLISPFLLSSVNFCPKVSSLQLCPT